MLYVKPKKYGTEIDFGRGRKVRVPLFNIVEVDEEKMTACIKSFTNEVMIYHGTNGVIPITRDVLARMLANTKKLYITNSFTFTPLD